MYFLRSELLARFVLIEFNLYHTIFMFDTNSIQSKQNEQVIPSGGSSCQFELEYLRPCIHVFSAIKTTTNSFSAEVVDAWDEGWLNHFCFL